MRKLLVSVLSIGLLATPVAFAFAADENRENADVQSEQTNYPALMDADLLTEARNQYAKATELAERKEEARERRLERRQEQRREARKAERQAQVAAVAEPAPVEEAAPEQTSSGSGEATGGGGAGGSLASIRDCESGGDYSTDTGNGFYGAYQFDQSTWESVGGSGSPASASPAEQDKRAAELMAQSGSSPWPTCG